MSISEIQIIFQWWGMLFLLSLIFLPLAFQLFPSFFDKGYIFIKTLSIALITYLIFFLGILHLVPFQQITVIVLLLLLGTGIYYGNRQILTKKSIISLLPVIVLEESLFFCLLFFWVFIRGYNPEIHGLEKYMDFGFMNSILRSEFFPPKDMWFSPFTINYYYFGHLTTAVLTKLSGISSNYTYNLMLGTIVGLCFTSSFSIGGNLLFLMTKISKLGKLKILLAGLLTAFLLTFAGNLHTTYTLFKPYENEKPVPPIAVHFPIKIKTTCKQIPAKQTDCANQTYSLSFVGFSPTSLGFSPATFPNSYWYPNATRFIYNTIHEFPIYSWVVADLHGHVLDIPFVLLIIGVLLSFFVKSKTTNNKSQTNWNLQRSKNQTSTIKIIKSYLNYFIENLLLDIRYLILLGLLLAVMYMTNAWDGLIYLLLTGFVILALSVRKYVTKNISFTTLSTIFFPTVISSVIVFICFILFSLPFSLLFKPFVSGIGILCVPNNTVQWLSHVTTGSQQIVDHISIGPFLLEKDHCQKSPLWQLFILYGFFLFYISCFLIFLRKVKQLTLSDMYVLCLISLSLILIIIPEFIYVKDIYPAHYRANTMFKLVFQSFMMLSIVSGYVLVRILAQSRELSKTFKGSSFFIAFFLLSLLLLTGVFTYPFLATKAYYNNLQTFTGIDGTKYLETLHPDDYKAIDWMNKHIKGQPVILEGQGDSYTDYGRISVHTGLPTVLGWTVHEWLWRGRYDLDTDEKGKVKPEDILDVPAPRVSEISTLYESTNENQVRDLISKYKIEYIYIGDLEREKYPNLREEIFTRIGTIIYQIGNTKIYKINT